MTDLKVRGRFEEFADGLKPWSRGLFVDVGSTYTKLLVVRPPGDVVARAEARTTIESDVLKGVLAAVEALPADEQGPFDWALASSSAAGGLRMATIGLTRALSGQAGSMAALGSGGKVVASEAGYLDDDAISRIVQAGPHLILLCGGTNGGNEEALLFNARRLAELDFAAGVIVAGNANASEAAARILSSGNRVVKIAANVFPKPGEIEIADTREAVRELFLLHITKAKGLTELMDLLKTECEPTPLAVSRALWDFPTSSEESVVLVDLGGATTDVHSAGAVDSAIPRLVDLPTPEVMRTVEGDLGMRWGAPGVADAAPHIFESLGVDAGSIRMAAKRRHENVGMVPDAWQELEDERVLAVGAVAVAIERHAGRVVVRHQPWGDRYRVTGKDLRNARLILATGGVFRYLQDPERVVEEAIDVADSPMKPVGAEVLIDGDYRIFAIGLAARHNRDLAREMTRSLIGTYPGRRST